MIRTTAAGTIDLRQLIDALVKGDAHAATAMIEQLQVPHGEARPGGEIGFDPPDLELRLLNAQALAIDFEWNGDIRMAAELSLALIDAFEALGWMELPGTPLRRSAVANSMTVASRTLTDGGGRFRDLLGRAGRWAEWLDRAGCGEDWRAVQCTRVEACIHSGLYETAAEIFSEIRERIPDFLNQPIERRLSDRLDDLLRAADRPDSPDVDWKWITERSVEDPVVANALNVSEGETPDEVYQRLAQDIGVLIGDAPAELAEAVRLLPRAGHPLFTVHQVLQTIGEGLKNGSIPLSTAAALAHDARAAALHFDFWHEAADLGWIEMVALRRQNRLDEAIIVLRELRGSVRERQEGIKEPLLRAALNEYLPSLYGVSAEVLFDLGSAATTELFEVVEEAKGRILAALVEQHDEHRAGAKLPRLVELLRSSPRPARYITLFADQEQTYAVAVAARGDLRTARFGVGRAQLAGAAQELGFLNDGQPGSFVREAGIDADHPFETDYSAVLRVLAPLAEWLGRLFVADPPAAGEVICIAPDGPLYNLPLACLEVDGKALIEHAAITFVPSFEVLAASAAMRQSAAHERACTVTVPRSTEFDSGLYDAHTYVRDAREVANRWTTTELPLPECDPDRLLARDLDNVLLHIGAHGIFDPARPLDGSGIVLTSGGVLPSGRGNGALLGLLNPRNAARLRIRGSHVTLRACVSGKTTEVTSREALGMIWALFQAGASSVVAAAWHADLRSASHLLSRFYSHLASDRCVPLALRGAALATREAGENWHHPYHYAAFNAFGYWS